MEYLDQRVIARPSFFRCRSNEIDGQPTKFCKTACQHWKPYSYSTPEPLHDVRDRNSDPVSSKYWRRWSHFTNFKSQAIAAIRSVDNRK